MSQAALLKPAKQPAPARRRFTLEEYHWLVQQGFFREDRVELIDGEIVHMAPTGPEHSISTDRIARYLVMLLSGKPYYVRIQNPLTIGEHEPVPDVAVVPGSPEDYRQAHPSSALLVIEVADTSLEYDRTVKASLYTSAGIPEYWVVNLVERRLEVYREPTSPAPEAPFNALYRSLRIYHLEETVSPLFAPEVSVKVGELIR
jgi:Uma2 family endonuclease